MVASGGSRGFFLFPHPRTGLRSPETPKTPLETPLLSIDYIFRTGLRSPETPETPLETPLQTTLFEKGPTGGEVPGGRVSGD